jgi:superfamily II DNA or RNA helicase/ribonuclease HI
MDKFVRKVSTNTINKRIRNVDPENACYLQFDGGARGNPGIGGAGAVIYSDDKYENEIWSGSKFVGSSVTNNQAEYAGLLLGLRECISREYNRIHVEGDSMLVIKQMKGEFKIHHASLQILWREANALIKEVPKDRITFLHIPRSKNKRADKLSNDAMDSKEDVSTSADPVIIGKVSAASLVNESTNTNKNTSDEPPPYIGKKGYTLYKSSLALSDLTKIRNELTVKPYVPKSMVESKAFPLYREAPKKIYIPRHYGEEHFGSLPDDQIKLPRGEVIEDQYSEFNGSLREYQINIVQKYLNAVKNSGGGLLDVDPGKGKTVMALNIISQLKVKTLVIVHKSFLLNQWIERIEQFLPSARVGKIQGQIIDIEDKDIVIGMLQSLSMKEYASDTFDCFGLSIYDETHHLGAEVFSKSMLKITTNYTLGLSGTMQRKDGLTKVFKMFLGDVIHKEKSNTSEHTVMVKCVNYAVNDDEFNEMKYNYKGDPMYSTMISKLCTYNHRSEFILTIIETELKRDPNQQIMVLAHNKTLITYLHDAIVHRDMATAGYYVGGMKEEALKQSEGKKVIIATYAMASEGLDIKTLTTLIMASPKTDVCQSVGRILRTKHAAPLVIDIVDSHDIFVAQWRKRKAYYIKQKYMIVSISNNKYKEYAKYIEEVSSDEIDLDEEIKSGGVNDLSLWNVVSDPNKAKQKTRGGSQPSVNTLMSGSLDKLSDNTNKPREFVISTKTRKINKKNDNEENDVHAEERKVVLFDCLLNIDTS